MKPAKRSLSPAVWALFLILVAAVVVFAPAVNFQFVFDDRYQIAANPSITSWSYLPTYFRAQIWSTTGALTSYYRPVFLIVLRLWNSLVGLDPVGWHVLPIVVHLINVGLVFALVHRTTDDVTTGLIAAAIFAVHPVQIEAVASIYGITDAIMAVFLLGSLLAYLRWKDRASSTFLAISAILFAIALLTKESAIVFPFVIAAYDLTTRTSEEGSALKSRRVLPGALAAALLVAYLVARRLALGTWFGHVISPVSWTAVLFTAPLSLVTLLRLWIVPFGMSAFYNSPYVTRPELHFVAPLLMLIAIAAGVWFWSRRTRQPLIAFAALWTLISLAPVLNIRLLPENDFVHIRFLYVPSIALSLLAAIALRQLVSQPKFRLAIAGACVIVLAISTRAQLGFLHDNEALYLRGVAIAPNNPLPKNNLADDYVKAGRIDEAATLLDDNLRRHPDYWMSNYNRGYIAYRRQNWADVDKYMERATANGASETDAYVYRAFALLHLGHPREAEPLVRQAIALRPHVRTYHFVLGLSLWQQHRSEEALTAFLQELAIDPTNRDAALHAAELRAQLHK